MWIYEFVDLRIWVCLWIYELLLSADLLSFMIFSGNEEFRASTGWLERFKRRYNIRSFKPGEEDTWKPSSLSRTSWDDSTGTSRSRSGDAAPSGRKAQRLSGKRACKNRSLEHLERTLEGSSPPTIKSEIDVSDDYEYTDVRPEVMSPDVPNSLHPLVSLEEGHFNLDLPPVEEIPSAGEAASMLSKVLVWAAAQPESTPQELFILKQLQTKAALKCIMRATQWWWELLVMPSLHLKI